MFEKEKIISFDDLGNITFRKNNRAKHYRILVKKTGDVFVTVPILGTWKKAIDFVRVKSDWIIRCREKYNNVPLNLVDPDEEYRLAVAANNYIPGRLMQLAEQNGFIITGIRINSAKSRWGSCNSRNSINISKYIMRLPVHLVDFILLHELTHTLFKDHQQGFHDKLNEICGGKEKQYSREIKDFLKNQ